MCSKPSKKTTSSQEPIQAAQAVAGNRNKQSGLGGRDVRTSPRGLAEDVVLSKKALLGE